MQEGTTGFATAHRSFGSSCSSTKGQGTTAQARPAAPAAGEGEDERWLRAFRWVENILAVDAGNRVKIADAGGLGPLVALALGGTPGQKKDAATALVHLAANADNRKMP